jgi:hypothetical protein
MSASSEHSHPDIYFYGYNKGDYPMFSNFYRCQFLYENESCHSSEQAMMYGKAVLMGDEATADKIIKASTPRACKILGRQVKPWNEELWKAERLNLMTEILVCKFSQNSELKRKLLETGDCKIAEASPRDTIWGIGIGVQSARRGRAWRGSNLLGQALMATRDILCSPNAQSE